MKRISIFFLLIAIASTTIAQDTLRIMDYNLLNYPGSDAATRDPYFRRVVHSAKPDVIVSMEMVNQTGVNTFLNDVLNYYQPELYSTIPFHDGPDTDPHIFYKTSKVTLIDTNFIATALRNIGEFVVRVNSTSDTLHLFAVHLKASTGYETERLAECTILRNYTNNLHAGTKFMIMGDFNFYTSAEPGFVKLTENQADNDGRAKDPINQLGDWHDDIAFDSIHTQSPRTRSFGGGATGGMDDRFDLIMTSYSSLDSNILISSYKAYGNDGNHMNDSINHLPNTAVPDSVANGLHYASDHIPVICDFVFKQQSAIDTVSIKWNTGWNMISLPLGSLDSIKTHIFPTAISDAFLYTEGAYHSIDTLRMGQGFWLKFASADSTQIIGSTSDSLVTDVVQGWNLVGTMNKDIAVSSISTDPPDLLESSFFSYNAGYLAVDTLSSGQAYWIKAKSTGKIILK